MLSERFFPDIVTDLPQPDIPFDGLTSFLLQCTDHQVVIMSFEKDAQVAEHRHEAQWGVVLDGKIELTIDGKNHVYEKGDTYFIPKNAPHSARIGAGYKDLTLFGQKDRYGEKAKV